MNTPRGWFFHSVRSGAGRLLLGLSLPAGLVFALGVSAAFPVATLRAATADAAPEAMLVAMASPPDGGTLVGGGAFFVGSVQTLTAIPAAGFDFGGWNDGEPNATRAVVVTGGVGPFVARFLPRASTLTVVVDPLASGTVTASPAKTTYTYLEQVRLTAQPAAGYAFTGWTDPAPFALGPDANRPDVLVTSNPLVLTMTRSFTLVAHFTRLAEGPEIDLLGRGVSIAAGDTTPTAEDDTEFGTAALLDPAVAATTANGFAIEGTAGTTDNASEIARTRVRHTFVIRNAGNAPLNLTGVPVVAKGGANPADFSVTQPAVTAVLPGRAVSFDVTFVPGAVGVRTATLSIASNDADESPYTFVVRGTGGPALVPYLPTAQQTTIASVAAAGEFRATVAIQFNPGGYRVEWGPAVGQGNIVVLNARVYQTAGAAPAVLTTLTNTYSLGRLAAGDFQLQFLVAGQVVKTVPLAIRTLATAVVPAEAGRIELNPAPVGPGCYLADTRVSLLAIPLAPMPVPMGSNGAPEPVIEPPLPPSISPVPRPGNVFQHWSGDASGTANPLALTVEAHLRVVANFAPAPVLPTVVTGAVTEIAATSARVEGTVVTAGDAPVTERGFLLQAAYPTPIMGGTTHVDGSTTARIAAAVTKFVEGEGPGAFTRMLSGLSPATPYWVRAYATSTAGTAYGQIRAFTTLGGPNPNTPPTISHLADQAIPVGGSTGPLAFTVGDAETAAEDLVVSGAVWNPLPLANVDGSVTTSPLPFATIVLGGKGAARTVTVTPAPNLALVMRMVITVRDAGGLTATTAFSVTIGAAADQAPTVTVPPGRAVRLGGVVTLTAAASGASPLTYQWRKDGVDLVNAGRLGGATSRTLTITNAQFADAGDYVVVVTNAVGWVTSTPVALAVVDSQHTVVGANLGLDGTVTVANTLTYAGNPTALAWQVILPDGWSYAAGSGAEGDIKPIAGTTGLAEWAWTVVPGSPVSFTYTLDVPPGATGDRALRALVIFRQASGPTNLLVLPDPLLTPNVPGHHSADTNRDSRISLLELTRVIELYNTRNGTVRTGGYAVAFSISEDGFAPDPARPGNFAALLAHYYSGDSDRDGKLSLLELTRMVELYNAREGTMRTGAYHVLSGTEDGFAAGP